MSAPQLQCVGEDAIDTPPVDRRHRLEMLEDCRELVLSRLSQVVKDALAGISDQLTELALRETRRDAQQALLDAVSLVRRHHAEIELRFHDTFADIFERRMRGEPDSADPAPTHKGELALVDESELGERLALERLVQRARSKLDPDEVLGVRARLGALVEREWFDEKRHPASPEAVFEALRRTLEQLKTRADVRDALLQALEPHVSANLNGIYSNVNERLRNGRILPSIRAQIVNAPNTGKNPQAPKPEAPIAAPGAAGAASGSQAGGHGAADGTVSGGPGPDPSHDAGVGAGVGTGVGGAAFPGGLPDADRFTDLLRQYVDGIPGARRLAAQVLTDSAAFDSAGLQDTGVNPSLMDALSAIQAGFGEPGGTNMQAALVEQTSDKGTALDQLTAEIVAIVFDHLYADRRLPDPIKQQLLRLQIVALKAALIDRSFFARSSHPMRRLIDAISEASVDPDADVGPDSAFVSGVTEIVDWVISSFENDLSVFDDAALRFDMLVSIEARRNAERQAEIARQAERLEAIALAQQQAHATIELRIDGSTPRFVRRFVDHWWSRWVAIERVDHGSQAEAAALGCVEALVWSVAPKAAEDIPRLAGLLPKLIGELTRGIAPLEMDETERQAFFDDLLKWHTRAIQQAKSAGAGPLPALVDESAAGAGSWARATTIVEEESEEAGAAIEALRLGDTIEFVELDGSRVRLRLAWLSPSRRLFMLTRFPDIARPVRRAELARLIDAGRARAAGGATALDRAIAAIAAIADRRSAAAG